MMKMTILRNSMLFLGLTAMGAMLGCENRVAQSDVDSAQEAVTEEQQETAETRADANAEVREEANETDQARREAMKPNLDADERADAQDAVREEEQETDEVRREGEQAVREEAQETDEAVREEQTTEAQLAAQTARDVYVKQAESQITQAEDRIEILNTEADKLEGVAKEQAEEQIDLIQKDIDRVQEQIGEMNDAELLEWKTEMPDVDAALKDLAGHLGNAAATTPDADVDIDF